MKILSIYLEPGSNDTLPKRLESLGQIVQAKRPEFVAIHNVTNDIVKKVKGTPWGARFSVLQNAYTYETRKNITSALLSTYPCQDHVSYPYEDTTSGKMILNGFYVMNDKQNKPFVIAVGTTTLEHGLKASEAREKQLNEVLQSMCEVDNAFLAGGFNIDSDIDGELTLQGGWEDAWLKCGNTESSGYTYDPKNNPLIKDDPLGPGRPDRLFFKSRNYKLEGIEVVGNKHPSVVSTHYGILAHLSPLDIPNPKLTNHPSVFATFKRSEWSVQFQDATGTA